MKDKERETKVRESVDFVVVVPKEVVEETIARLPKVSGRLTLDRSRNERG